MARRSPETAPVPEAMHEMGREVPVRKRKLRKVEAPSEVEEQLKEVHRMEAERSWREFADKVARESGFEELEQVPFSRFLEEKKSEIDARAVELVNRGEAKDAARAMEAAAREYRDEYERVYIKGETAEVLREIREDKEREAERERLRKEAERKARLDLEARGELFDKVMVDEAYQEKIRALDLAAKTVPTALSEITTDPRELAFFEAGENPIILAEREALQRELDESVDLHEVSEYSLDDFQQAMEDLRSVEEGGKMEPVKIQSEKERVSALYEHGGKLRRGFLEEINLAHKEFPESFPFTGQEYDRLVIRVEDLEQDVAEEKKSMKFGARLRKLFEGPTPTELDLRAAKSKLAEWDRKVGEYVATGKSKLAAKYREQQREESRRMEARTRRPPFSVR